MKMNVENAPVSCEGELTEKHLIQASFRMARRLCDEHEELLE